MTPFMGGDDVQSRRKTESDPADEGIREAHAIQVDASVRAKEGAHVVLRCQEAARRVIEWWGRSRADRARRFRFQTASRRRLEIPDEPSTDEAGPRGAAPNTTIAKSSSGRWLHRPKVDSVAGCKMVEARRNTPRARLGLPGSLCLGQASYEPPRITFRRVERRVQRLQIGRQSCHVACLR
jgi:hypothetical protein